MLQAKTGTDANRRFVGAQPGTSHGATKFTNALFYNENRNKFIKTASLHVTEHDLLPLVTEPNYINNFVQGFLKPLLPDTLFNTPINPGRIHILLGQGSIQTFAKSYKAGAHEKNTPC